MEMELPPRGVCVFAAAAGIAGLTAGAAFAAYVQQHGPQHVDQHKAREHKSEPKKGMGCKAAPHAQCEGQDQPHSPHSPRHEGKEVARRPLEKGIVMQDVDEDEVAACGASSSLAVQRQLTLPGSWRHRAEELCRDLARVKRESESSQKQFMTEKALLNQRLDEVLQILEREQKLTNVLRNANEVLRITKYQSLFTLTHSHTFTHGWLLSVTTINLFIFSPSDIHIRATRADSLYGGSSSRRDFDGVSSPSFCAQECE